MFIIYSLKKGRTVKSIKAKISGMAMCKQTISQIKQTRNKLRMKTVFIYQKKKKNIIKFSAS